MPGTVAAPQASVPSFGVALKYCTTSNGTFLALADIVDIDSPKIKHSTYEDKSLDQADYWVPKLGSFVDGGQVTFTCKYNGARYGLFLGHVTDQAPMFWKIVVPKEAGESAGGTIAFAALVGEFGTPFKDDGGRLLMDVTLEVSGPVTFTPGATS